MLLLVLDGCSMASCCLVRCVDEAIIKLSTPFKILSLVASNGQLGIGFRLAFHPYVATAFAFLSRLVHIHLKIF